MTIQTETKTQDRSGGGSKLIAQAEMSRPGGSDGGGEGCGFIIMVIAFVLLGLLFWRMS